MVRRLDGHIHFAHRRRVRTTGERRFPERPYPSRLGRVDVRAELRAPCGVGFTGTMRPGGAHGLDRPGADPQGERGVAVSTAAPAER